VGLGGLVDIVVVFRSRSESSCLAATATAFSATGMAKTVCALRSAVRMMMDLAVERISWIQLREERILTDVEQHVFSYSEVGLVFKLGDA
jgi:hypothetical protein